MIQEDEADRIGLLYMALAGYDPQVVPAIWSKASEKYGSNPTDYTYDHSLNNDRINKTRALVPLAQKYFIKQGVINDQHEVILSNNDLIKRDNHQEKSGVESAISAAADTYNKRMAASNEETIRKINMRRDQQIAQMNEQMKLLQAQNEIVTFTRTTYSVTNTATGRTITGQLSNTNSKKINNAVIAVGYKNFAGQLLYTQEISLQDIGLPPWQSASWSVPILTVPGAQGISAVVTHIDWDQ
jgi:hypothetical protein